MRLLTRDMDLLKSCEENISNIFDVLRELLNATVQKLTAVLPKEDNSTSVAITVEVLSILKRLCKNFDLIEFFRSNKSFSVIADLIVVNHPLVLKTLLDFLYSFFEKTEGKEMFVEEFAQIFYISKLLFVCEKYDDGFKVPAINLLTRVMDFKIVQDNFRRIRGVGVLVTQLRKNQNNLALKISCLNCMYKLIQRTEIVYDFKVFGIVPIL